MNQPDRRYQLERLSRSSRSLGRNALLYELEISRATLKRHLELLRGDIHPAPVSALDTGDFRQGHAQNGAGHL